MGPPRADTRRKKRIKLITLINRTASMGPSLARRKRIAERRAYYTIAEGESKMFRAIEVSDFKRVRKLEIIGTEIAPMRRV